MVFKSTLNIANCIIIRINYNDYKKHNDILVNNIKIIVNKNNFNIQIPENLNLEQPIYIINDLVDVKENNYNLIINVGKYSKVNIIDHRTNQNNITEIICNTNVRLDYYLIQEQGKSNLNIRQYKNSICDVKIIAIKSDNQLNVNVELIETNSGIKLNILQKSSYTYKNSINLLIKHLGDYCYSDTVSRIIAEQQSKSNFIGKIVVAHTGKDTQANLQTKGLVLHKQASIVNSPELVIDNSEIVCTHGASIGNLDEEALFYLQARGMNIQDAISLLIEAFQQPILNVVKYKEILEYCK